MYIGRKRKIDNDDRIGFEPEPEADTDEEADADRQIMNLRTRTVNIRPDYRPVKIAKMTRLRPVKTAEQDLAEGIIQLHLILRPYTKPKQLWLEQLCEILEVMLPNIPSKHIHKLVFDKGHENFVIVKEECVIGGLTFHPIPEINFTEVVFVSISESEQHRGYGSLLLSEFQKYVKQVDLPLRVITFADKKNATSFFKKAGFETRKRTAAEFDDYLRRVPQYSHAILMVCELLPMIEYPNLQQPIDEILVKLKKSEHAWPFAKPVDERIVPWYYQVVKKPMDLQTITDRNNEGYYHHPRLFFKDIKQLFDNCYFVNEPNSVYYEHGYELNKFFNRIRRMRPYFQKSDICTNIPTIKPLLDGRSGTSHVQENLLMEDTFETQEDLTLDAEEESASGTQTCYKLRPLLQKR